MAANMVAKLLIAGVIGAVVGAAVVATAAPEFNTHGNRFKPLSYAELTPEQRVFADKEIAGGRKPENGPFNIYLRSPEMAELSRPLANWTRRGDGGGKGSTSLTCPMNSAVAELIPGTFYGSATPAAP